MNVPRIMVVGGDGFSSQAIERAGFGLWCHMANLLADDVVLDARDNVVGGIPPGVRMRPKGYLNFEPKWAIFQAPLAGGYDKWKAAGVEQIGKPYDERGILDFAESVFEGTYVDASFAGEKSTAWFCDCLSAWMAIQSGDIPKPPNWYKLFTQTPTAALNLFIGAGWTEVASRGI